VQYPTEPISEEAGILKLLTLISKVGFTTNTPAHSFIKDIANKGALVQNYSAASNIFFSNYPDPDVKFDIDLLKRKVKNNS